MSTQVQADAAIPIRKLRDAGYPLSPAQAYREIAAGRLRAIKRGWKTFVLPQDAETWLQNLPAMAPKASERVVDAAVAKLEELGRAVNDGRVDRNHAVTRLAAVVEKAGLTLQAAA
jgi:hypothetical protein